MLWGTMSKTLQKMSNNIHSHIQYLQLEKQTQLGQTMLFKTCTSIDTSYFLLMCFSTMEKGIILSTTTFY